MKDSSRLKARQLAWESIQRGDASGWFEVLYADADGNENRIPWADMTSNPNLVEWLERRSIHENGRRALVVGCGLGDDAEELARRGFEVVLACDRSILRTIWIEKSHQQDASVLIIADNSIGSKCAGEILKWFPLCSNIYTLVAAAFFFWAKASSSFSSF